MCVSLCVCTYNMYIAGVRGLEQNIMLFKGYKCDVIFSKLTVVLYKANSIGYW